MVKNRKDLTPRRSLSRSTVKGNQQPRANVKVVVRVRPHNQKELGDNFKTVIKCINAENLTFDPEEDPTPFFYHGVEQKGRDLLKKGNKNMHFSFDHVFDKDSNNEEVFNFSTKSLIETLMDGYNCSVFAYGATGAGKTYTMLGSNLSPGITYLTMQELFKQKEALLDDRDFELAVSYLEVYNENVQDLLKPGGCPLHLREDKKLGVIVAGITLKRIANAEELFVLLEKGNKCRTQHPTDANAESSRSHAVFQVYIRMSMKVTGQVRLAKLSMIDLAGSERGAATGFKGARFTEGANINKSLLALGNCINSLASGQKHVPYRDSKLTRLLKDSLGGNCQTVMIANISPSSLSYEDTYNTLNYATRAKKIKSHCTKNVVNNSLSPMQYMKIIDDLNKEILRLKSIQHECKQCLGPVTEEVESVPASVAVVSVAAAVKPEAPLVDMETQTRLVTLFNEMRSLQERVQKLKWNKSLLNVRVALKEEANNRLSDFCVYTPDKEKGHKKLTETVDRFKKQVTVYSDEMNQLNKQIASKEEEISQLVGECPALKDMAELLRTKVEMAALEMELEEMRKIDKMKSNELKGRGSLMENMAQLLQPWFFILRSNGHITDAMTKQYQDLRSYVEGICSVQFEESEDSPANKTICITSNKKAKMEEAASGFPLKRKWENEFDSTFVLSPRASKICAEPVLTKASPSKKTGRLVKVSHRLLKENRGGVNKPIGTMGTSTRFPSYSHVTATLNRNKIKPTAKYKTGIK